MSIKVSVIIPVYNVEKYLRTCLDSALNQDFDSYEVIAVNDGSTDNSGEILSEYAEKYKNLKVITQENMGLGGARNTGIESSQGEYLFFLDSDDYILDNTLKFLYDKSKESAADIVCFGMNYVTENDDIISMFKVTDSDEEDLNPEECLVMLASNAYAWNKFYKASLFKDNNIKFPQRIWYEDLATVPKVTLKSKKIILTDKVFYNYLQRPNSIMNIKNEDRTSEMMIAVDSVLDFYKQNNVFEKYYENLEYLTVLNVLVLATNRVASTNPKHPLLEQFYEYTVNNFPNFKTNAKLGECLSFRRKAIYFFAKHKMHRSLYWLNKLNNLR